MLKLLLIFHLFEKLSITKSKKINFLKGDEFLDMPEDRDLKQRHGTGSLTLSE